MHTFFKKHLHNNVKNVFHINSDSTRVDPKIAILESQSHRGPENSRRSIPPHWFRLDRALRAHPLSCRAAEDRHFSGPGDQPTRTPARDRRSLPVKPALERQRENGKEAWPAVVYPNAPDFSRRKNARQRRGGGAGGQREAERERIERGGEPSSVCWRDNRTNQSL